MMKQLKMVVEHMICHLKVNSLFTKLVDLLIKDRKDENYQGAKELLKEVYAPVVFSQKKAKREVLHDYNLQIVIPMYNARKYINNCLDSILQQETIYTYKIYLVDDGSTDGTSEQVRQCYHDERICLIYQNNAGAAVARNTALEVLVADYVMFVDADDILKNGAISQLLDAAYSNKADVVEGGYEVFQRKVKTRKTHDNEIVNEACGKLWGFPWAKVISADLFVDMKFPEKYWYEDTFISYLVYTRCNCAVTISNIVYSYRKTKSGMSHIRGNDRKILDAFWILNLVLDEMIRRNIPFSQSIYEQFLISITTSTKRILYLNKELRRCVLAAYSEILHNHFEQYSTNITSLKVFEKIIKNNDFKKYCYIAICLENL